jgi:hypothetical protein
MGGMRGAGSMARGMGQYGKGGAKPSGRATPSSKPQPRGDANIRGKRIKGFSNAPKRLFDSKFKQLEKSNGYGRITPTKTDLNELKKQGRMYPTVRPSVTSRQKPTPVKPSAKKGRR